MRGSSIGPITTHNAHRIEMISDHGQKKMDVQLPTNTRVRTEPIVLSSTAGLAKHAWDTAQEHILRKWKCQLFVHMYMQAEARAYFRALYNWMSTPVIILNTTASAAIFVTSRSDIKDYVLLAMTLSAALLATLTRSMQVAELYQQHGSSCLRYSSLLHDIESVLNMRVDLRPSALSYIDKVKSDMDNIMSAQAEPPEHVVRSFERSYGRVDGLLYGEDVVRVVLTNLRTNSYLNNLYAKTHSKPIRRQDSQPLPPPPSTTTTTPATSSGQVNPPRWSLLPFLSRQGTRPVQFLKMHGQRPLMSVPPSPIHSEEFRRMVASVDRIHGSIDLQHMKETTTGDVEAGLADELFSNRATPKDLGAASTMLSVFDSSASTSEFDRSDDGLGNKTSRFSAPGTTTAPRLAVTLASTQALVAPTRARPEMWGLMPSAFMVTGAPKPISSPNVSVILPPLPPAPAPAPALLTVSRSEAGLGLRNR